MDSEDKNPKSGHKLSTAPSNIMSKTHAHGSACDHDHDGAQGFAPVDPSSKIQHHHHHHHGPHLHHHHSVPGESHERVLRGLRLAFFLNLSLALFEFVGGYLTNSVAVMSDALHDLGDALALGLAWSFEKKSVQKATESYTYGFRRFSLLSSVFTGSILLLGSVFIIRESVERLFSPQPVVAWGMVVMAVVGIIVNGWSLLQFSRQGGASERMIRLHFIEDLAGWVIVLAAGTLMQFVDWPWLDALLGAALSIWIVVNVIRQLISVASIFLQALPLGLNMTEIEGFLKSQDLVAGSHHTHIWSLDGEKHILTTHLKLEPGVKMDSLPLIKSKIKEGLNQRFGIFEATIEFEFDGENCEVPNH